jgi:CheY-like chemotaxis protein
MMPEMDGIEAARMIREEIDGDYAKTVPIIALTANALVGSAQLFLQSGFQDFLSKPVNVTDLDTVLNRWVKRSGYHSEPVKINVDSDDDNNPLNAAEVDGVDIQGGIGRYGGAEQYAQVLRSFINHTPAILEKLSDFTETELNSYAVAIHGVKGSAYGVSANRLGRLAEDLEAAAKRGDPQFISENNSLFINSAKALVVVLDDLLRKRDVEKEMKPLPDAAELEKLKEACKEFDILKMEEALNKLESYSYETGAGFVRTLRNLADNLEYEELLKTLEEFKG